MSFYIGPAAREILFLSNCGPRITMETIVAKRGSCGKMLVCVSCPVFPAAFREIPKVGGGSSDLA